MNAQLVAIGEITTPYQTLDDCPNNINSNGATCELKLFNEFADGLSGLHVGDSILVLYWFESAKRQLLSQRSISKNKTLGCFSLRSPHRPNPIAAATVTIEQKTKTALTVRGLDCLSGTKLLDIKPAL
jgi:tRNA-Thr(GGU) m(6)t(6)A37 methyltransferase TsaA